MVKSRVGVSPAPSSSSLSPSTAACPTEYCVLLMGTWHKKPLFEQLRSVAHKFEQHIQYADTCYLTFQFGQETVVLELIDPGTEHTGAREMAIRKADAAILCYAAYSPASFHTLASIADDFQWLEQGRQPVALLLCDEDQLIENSGPGESGERERADDSEGYASNSSNSPPEGDSPPLSPNSRRRSSMDRIQRGRNEGQCPISREQGEQLAKMFGPDCEFRSRSFQSAEGLPDLVQQLIQRIKQHRQNSQRQRSRSRSGSRRRPSPIIPSILRRSSLKKLLTHSKSDAAKRGSHDGSAESAVEQQQKRHSTLGTALRVLTHPLQRTKSQNKVAAANNTERNDTITGSQHSLPAASAASGPRTPFGLEVIPPTGEPCAEPFAYDPVRVNNFVGADQQQNGGETNGNGQQQTKRASILGMERPPTGKGIRLRAFSSPTGSTACVIQ